MALSTGARLGPYEIVSLVGVGGMGEVYKGRDTRLDRTVAIKLLPSEVADRADRRARFETEARAISALNHPHICTLFDVGDEGGRPFIVMEFLDGETLDDRLTRGALPASDVVRYAVQIADALAHAHRARIVHRDLKPGNVMLTATGAKLLDFGLARWPTLEPAGGALTTVTVDQRKLTAEGTILGTFQYMAPEQLEGKEADARTDIFAFGTLVYEMATGRKAFSGESQASLIASILTAQPQPISISRVEAGLPPALDHLVERCLAKSPDDRWQTARDLKLELDWITGGAQAARSEVRRSTSRFGRREQLAWVAAVLALTAAIAVFVFARPRQLASTDVTRFVITPAAGSIIGGTEQRTRLAVSPDGRQIAFVATTEGRMQVWVRPFDAVVARPLPGTEDGVSPFWSPDSKYIGFYAPDRGELRKVAVAGGPPRTICAAKNETLPDWGADGTILFTTVLDGLYRVSAEGGTPTRVTTVDKQKQEINHYWPSFLPDGKHFLYLATARESDTAKAPPSLYVAALDGSNRTLVPRIHSRTVYAAPGYLLFVEDGALLAQPFDPSSLRASGEAVRIVDGVASLRTIGSSSFSLSAGGTLAYLGTGDEFQFLWYDRLGNVSDPGWTKQTYGSVRISPDGEQALVDVYDPRNGESDIWIYDLARNVPRRFIADLPSDRNAVWSPDARRVLYSTERGFFPNLFTKAFEGNGESQTMVAYPAPIFPEDWSSDNKWIAFNVTTVKTGIDLWMKPLEGDAKVRPFLTTAANESGARFSPDAKWVAFGSDETKAAEVYVAPVGEPGQRRQVSIGGGTTPRWRRRDSKELFYASVDGRSIMSVPIESLVPFRVGKPTRLFNISPMALARGGGGRTVAYDVTPDGQRFLVSQLSGELRSSQITVVLNWPALLRQ